MSNLKVFDTINDYMHKFCQVKINTSDVLKPMNEVMSCCTGSPHNVVDINTELAFTGNPLSVAIVSAPTSSTSGICYLDLTSSFKKFLSDLVTLNVDYHFGFVNKQSSIIINNSSVGYCRIALSWVEFFKPYYFEYYVLEDQANNKFKITTSATDPDYISAKQSAFCTTYTLNLLTLYQRESITNSCDGALNKIYYYTSDNFQELTINQPYIQSGFGFGYSTYDEEYHIVQPPEYFKTNPFPVSGYPYNYYVAWDIDVRTQAYFIQGTFGSFNGTSVITATAGSNITTCSDVAQLVVSDLKLATTTQSPDSLEVSSFVAR